MDHFNAWSNPSQTSTHEAVQMAAFLEERSHAPDVVELNRKFIQMASAKPGEHVLEVGCGSGALCRLLAKHVQPSSSVSGVDISPEMAAAARQYARSDGFGISITFVTAAAESLPYSDASFDIALAARLLLHVAEPDLVIREMIRVVRPGGRILAMDWDFETVTVDHPNRDLTRRLLHFRNDFHGGNNWSGRQLWRRLQSAGLQNLSVLPLVSVARGEAEGLTQSLRRAAQVACEGGAISKTEQESWVQDLKERIQAGTFFASIVYFIAQGYVDSRQQAVV